MPQDLERNMIEFLEEWSPLRRYWKPVVDSLGNMERPSIHMHCPQCGSGQTFVNAGSEGTYSLYEWLSAPYEVYLARYLCASCQKFGRLFVLETGHVDGRGFIRKIGQKPDWEASLDANVARVLGPHEVLFRRGVDCETSGYGIGAFAYYRRLVEDVLSELLNMIPPLLEGEAKVKYAEALERTSTTPVAQEKIALVKELLPASLRRDGINPLEILHDALSGGLHAESDEECLDLAATVREALVYLVDELKRADDAHRKFTEGMRRFLDKRAQNKARGPTKPGV